MSGEDDGIVQSKCCQRKFCEYFVVVGGIVQSLVREEGQRMHLLISVFLGSLNVGK